MVGGPASSTTKTGRHDIAEILLKVALNTINQIKSILVTLRYGLREMISGFSALELKECICIVGLFTTSIINTFFVNCFGFLC
jgi:hypothetical protein